MRFAPIPIVVAALLAGGCDRQSPPPEQGTVNQAGVDAVPPPSPDEAPSGAPAAAVGTFDRSHKGVAAPDFAFTDPAGKPVTLAAFRGRPLLVNLWATWCAPCIKEMPTLDALAQRDSAKVKVLALSQDLDAAKIAPFFAKGGYNALQPYHDGKLAFSVGLGVNLPTTILYDSVGKEVWRFSGTTDWAGPEAAKALAEAS